MSVQVSTVQYSTCQYRSVQYSVGGGGHRGLRGSDSLPLSCPNTCHTYRSVGEITAPSRPPPHPPFLSPPPSPSVSGQAPTAKRCPVSAHTDPCYHSQSDNLPSAPSSQLTLVTTAKARTFLPPPPPNRHVATSLRTVTATVVSSDDLPLLRHSTRCDILRTQIRIP